MVLVGERGTGKSRVINAVDALCLAWGRQDSLIKAAPTGKAAVLINGRTLASVLLNLSKSKSNILACTISCLIIDEMSMITVNDLYDLDVYLRRITGIKMIFGGISIILCGDFLQLPPAGGRPLYKKPLNIINSFKEDTIEDEEEKKNNIEEEIQAHEHFLRLGEKYPELNNNPKKKYQIKKIKHQRHQLQLKSWGMIYGLIILQK